VAAKQNPGYSKLADAPAACRFSAIVFAAARTLVARS